MRGTALLLGLLAASIARADPPVPVAVFEVQFVNGSLEQTTPAETERLRALTQQLRDALAASGRYKVVDLAPVQAALDKEPDLLRCNGCQLPLAVKVGGRQAAIAWVHKVSNVVLDMNVEIQDATTGADIVSGRVELKGNSDEVWQHGLRYLLENKILVDRPGE